VRIGLQKVGCPEVKEPSATPRPERHHLLRSLPAKLPVDDGKADDVIRGGCFGVLHRQRWRKFVTWFLYCGASYKLAPPQLCEELFPAMTPDGEGVPFGGVAGGST